MFDLPPSPPPWNQTSNELDLVIRGVADGLGGPPFEADVALRGAAPDTGPAYFVEQIKLETARWRPIIQNAGIAAE